MSDMGKIVNSHTVLFERTFPGPIEKVWEYISTEKGIAEWLCEDASIDARVGGRVELRFPGNPCNPSGCTIRGIIKEFEPPRVMAFSWIDTTSDLTSDVRFELEVRGDEVHLVLTHSRVSAHFMPKVGAGWHSHLEQLIAVLNSKQRPEFEAMFTELLKKYTGVLAGIVVSAVISPSISATTDAAFRSLSDQRQQLIAQYESTWKAADELEIQLDQLKHQIHADRKHSHADVEHKLKLAYADLQRVEQTIRDLDKDFAKR